MNIRKDIVSIYIRNWKSIAKIINSNIDSFKNHKINYMDIRHVTQLREQNVNFPSLTRMFNIQSVSWMTFFIPGVLQVRFLIQLEMF